MSQTYWKRTLASARESIWVHFKNDRRPDRLRDERSHEETNKTQWNAIIQITMGGKGNPGGRGDEEKKERKEQFAVNSFGSKSQPNGAVDECARWWKCWEILRSDGCMDGWDGELREIINCTELAHCFPGITALNGRHCCHDLLPEVAG